MPSNLEWKTSDPDNKDRGRGWYWFRGNSFKRNNGYGFSKYTGEQDKNEKAKNPSMRYRKSIGAKGRKNLQTNSPHKGDYSTGKSKRKPLTQPTRVDTHDPNHERHPVKKQKPGFF